MPGFASMNDNLQDDDDFSTIRHELNHHSDDEAHESGPGDYSSRMDEIFSDEEDEGFPGASDEDNDDDEAFVYTGQDAEPPVGGYHDQLKDVLGQDMDDSEDERLVDKSRIHETADVSFTAESTGVHEESMVFDTSPSVSSAAPSVAFHPMDTPSQDSNGAPNWKPRPFLHPTVSRLRSFVPQHGTLGLPSTSSAASGQRHAQDGFTPSHSQFSLSRTPSMSDLNAGVSNVQQQSPRQSFRWTVLSHLSEFLYKKKPGKAAAILGDSSNLGLPTVMAANGLICIGTDSGRVCVFDFQQNLKCICGDGDTGQKMGAVTALALSHDHTYVAVGHIHGHIQLFDILHPQAPTRIVVPASLAAVSSGRQEGHLFGSRIIRLGFISGRHTAIVSADDQGLAFYHSLGKVLFVEASDHLRILGKYPDEDPASLICEKSSSATKKIGKPNPKNRVKSLPQTRSSRPRKANSILAMASLPLAASAHPTDVYQLVSLLTPMKLVIIGLKPTAKTWFRHHREGYDDGEGLNSKWKGSLAWFPSVTLPNSDGELEKATPRVSVFSRKQAKDDLAQSDPMLAYSWGSTLCVLKIHETHVTQKIRNLKSGKIDRVPIGKVNFEEYGALSVDDDILSIQWLNINQILLFTGKGLDVYDVRTMKPVERSSFDTYSLVSPNMGAIDANDAASSRNAFVDVQQSIRAYKSKIFVLGHNEVRVGTLLTWADRILSFVQNGDFLSAIDMTRAYYLGEAEGNQNGLPEDPDSMRKVIGEKLYTLMVASSRYAFSEDRLTDSTHVTPDNRGVDRTSLFERLVATCAKSCIALGEYHFLFEDLFQCYEDTGILRIFLTQLEPFVLDNSINFIPPRITQRLIAMHQEDGQLHAAEMIIWHIDPECLDINQAISLCQQHHLYDALIYVYTRALRDYVSPVVELLGLIRKVLQGRKGRPSQMGFSDGSSLEFLWPNAYKIYPYLADVLAGLIYPSEKPLPEDEALAAQKEVHTFIFYGRSSVWPVGDSGKLVLTADEEGGVEPTYPYARLLLRFDAEAFLHTLDIAFEHAYLNDETQGVSRQIIVKILLEIMASPESGLSATDVTFVNIFLARNVPKYTQFIDLAPRSLQAILVGLAADDDQSTREDRQLAAEYLLSAYTPHDGDQILHMFEDAGFYRILRSWHQQDRQWAPLIKTYLHDPAVRSDDLFPYVEEVLDATLIASKNMLPHEVVMTVVDSLSQLLDSGVPQTAILLDKYLPGHHQKALELLSATSDLKRLAYLRCLIGPPGRGDDDGARFTRIGGPSSHVDISSRHLYLSLLCRYDPDSAIDGIKSFSPDYVDSESIVRICEGEKAYNAVVWLLTDRHRPLEALGKVHAYSQGLIRDARDLLLHNHSALESMDLDAILYKVQSIGRIGITVCLQHSQQASRAEVPLEDLWFKLLNSQIISAQDIASVMAHGSSTSGDRPTTIQDAVEPLRALVQETLASLVSVSSTKAVSFPRLFKRLVDSTALSRAGSENSYSEFRTILTGMLESYRTEEDLLVITQHLVERDLFDSMEELARERGKGWKSGGAICSSCKGTLTSSSDEGQPHHPVIVSRTGMIYHELCFHSDVATPL